MKKSPKKTTKSAPASKKRKSPKIADLSPKKNPRGGDKPPNYPDGGNNADS